MLYGYSSPRAVVGVPRRPAYGMGTIARRFAPPVNPKGSPIWSETWQQGAAGALRKVHPIAMNGCGCGLGQVPQTNRTSQTTSNIDWSYYTFILVASIFINQLVGIFSGDRK